MYADVHLLEDTTTLYVRWEIRFEGRERARCEALGGPLALVIEASDYVDAGGTFHERADVEVPIHPHAGRVNRGQAKFRDFESRRRFVERLQDAVSRDVTDFLYEARPGSLPVEGHVIRSAETRAA
jgi:hypothetical protein